MLLTCTDFAKNAKNWAILPFLTAQNDISTSKFSKKCHYGTGASFWAQKRNILLYASFSSCFCNPSKVNSQKQSILAKIGRQNSCQNFHCFAPKLQTISSYQTPAPFSMLTLRFFACACAIFCVYINIEKGEGDRT